MRAVFMSSLFPHRIPVAADVWDCQQNIVCRVLCRRASVFTNASPQSQLQGPEKNSCFNLLQKMKTRTQLEAALPTALHTPALLKTLASVGWEQLGAELSPSCSPA